MSEAFVITTKSERARVMRLGHGPFAVYSVIKEMALSSADMTALYHLKMIAAHIENTPSNVARWLRRLVDAGLVVIEAAIDHMGQRLFVPQLAEQLRRYRPARPVSCASPPGNPLATATQPLDSQPDSVDISTAQPPEETRVETEECPVFSNEKTAQAPVEKVESAKPSEPAKGLASQPESGLVRCEPARDESVRMAKNPHDRDEPMSFEDRKRIMRARHGMNRQEPSIDELREKAAAKRKELGIDTPLPATDQSSAPTGPRYGDLVKTVFDKGVELLTAPLYGKSEQDARKVVGMLRKFAKDAHGSDVKGDEAVVRAIAAAHLEKPVDAVPWLREAVQVVRPPR